jgi:hypothetical protein
MTKEHQKEFIENLCDNLKVAMLAKLDKIPDHWEDLELRQYLCYKAQQFNPQRMVLSGRRRYKKDVKENGL